MTVRARPGSPSRNLQLSNLIEVYVLACRAEGKSPRTIRWYVPKLRGFEEYLRSNRH